MNRYEMIQWSNNHRADRFLAHSGMVIPRSEVKYTLRRSTKVQLASWDEAVQLLDADALEPKLDYERKVIKEIIRKASHPFEEEAVFSNLVLRDAFLSEWSQHHVDPAETGGFIRELVNGFGSRSRGNVIHVGIFTAVVRFAYEMSLNFPGREDMKPDEPLKVTHSSSGLNQHGGTYKDYDLYRLIMDHYKDVGKIIGVAIEHETLDAEVLGRMMLAPDTSLALHQGIL